MRLSTVFILNALCNLCFGLALLFFPGWMMGLFGVSLNAGGGYLARMAGAAWLGFAALTWLGRAIPEERLRLAVLHSLFVWFATGILTLLYGQLLGITNFLGWFTILLSAFFLAAYGYFLFRTPTGAQTRSATG